MTPPVGSALATSDDAVADVTPRRRDRRWPPLVPLAIVGAMLICAIFAPLLSPHSPLEGSLGERLAPPMGMEGTKPGHFLGTDRHGRDTLSRLIYGAQISLAVSVVGITLTGAWAASSASSPASWAAGWTRCSCGSSTFRSRSPAS